MILAADALSGRKVRSSRLESASDEGNGNATSGRRWGVPARASDLLGGSGCGRPVVGRSCREKSSRDEG